MKLSEADRIKFFCREYSGNDENKFVRQLRAAKLTDAQIVAVIDAIESTCPHCYDNERGCKCSVW